jgi:hypothetical protein
MYDLRFLNGNTVKGNQTDLGPKRVDQQNLESGNSPHVVWGSIAEPNSVVPDTPETSVFVYRASGLPVLPVSVRQGLLTPPQQRLSDFPSVPTSILNRWSLCQFHRGTFGTTGP